MKPKIEWTVTANKLAHNEDYIEFSVKLPSGNTLELGTTYDREWETTEGRAARMEQTIEQIKADLAEYFALTQAT